MISAGIRDLKNNLSRYIRQLGVERRIVVTDRGRVVAELRLPESGNWAGEQRGAQYAGLVAAGVIRPAIELGDPLADWPTPDELRLPPGTAAALLDEDRGSR